MKISEAISKSDGNWFRPVEWAGCGQAYCMKGIQTCLVPSPRGGEPSMTANASFLAGDWEIVPPDTVLNERR